MNLLIYLFVAAVIGWVATEIMHDRSNLLINIIVAVAGAFLADYFIGPILQSGRSMMRSPFRPCWSRCLGLSSCWQSSISSEEAEQDKSRIVEFTIIVHRR